jgi:hypothetical protein
MLNVKKFVSSFQNLHTGDVMNPVRAFISGFMKYYFMK